MNTRIAFAILGVAMFAGFPAGAQGVKPLTQAEHIACGGISMAGISMSPEAEKAGPRRLYNFFLVSAAALDPDRGTREATTAMNVAMYRGSIEWIESMFGRSRSDDDKNAALARFKQEMGRCVDVLLAHERGIRESRP
jgi:hypothetical protein